MTRKALILPVAALLMACGCGSGLNQVQREENARHDELARAQQLEAAERRDPRKAKLEEAARRRAGEARLSPAEEAAYRQTQRELAELKHEEAEEAIEVASNRRAYERDKHREALKIGARTSNERDVADQEREIEEGVSLPPGVRPYTSSIRARILRGCLKGGDHNRTCRCFVVQLETAEDEHTAIRETYAEGLQGAVSRAAASGILEICRRKAK